MLSAEHTGSSGRDLKGNTDVCVSVNIIRAAG